MSLKNWVHSPALNCKKVFSEDDIIIIPPDVYETHVLKSLRQQMSHYLMVLHHHMIRHQMETFSALLAICVGNSPVTGEFPADRPVTQSFDVFFDPCLKKRLSKTIARLVIWDAIAPIITSL